MTDTFGWAAEVASFVVGSILPGQWRHHNDRLPRCTRMDDDIVSRSVSVAFHREDIIFVEGEVEWCVGWCPHEVLMEALLETPLPSSWILLGGNCLEHYGALSSIPPQLTVRSAPSSGETCTLTPASPSRECMHANGLPFSPVCAAPFIILPIPGEEFLSTVDFCGDTRAPILSIHPHMIVACRPWTRVHLQPEPWIGTIFASNVSTAESGGSQCDGRRLSVPSHWSVLVSLCTFFRSCFC